MANQKELSQAEYDLEMNRLREARDEEYRKIDQRKVINVQRYEFLLNQRKDIVAKIHECHTENKQIDADKNDIQRRFHAKLTELRKRRNESIGAHKEISSQVAYQLHSAVEGALKAALADTEGIHIGGIKCNYDYDDNGKITFTVNIPKECKTE